MLGVPSMPSALTIAIACDSLLSTSNELAVDRNFARSMPCSA